MKNKNHPRGKQDICFANIASPGGDFYFSQKRKRRNGQREESLPKNVFFYSFRVLILFVVRFSLKVAQDSSNLEEIKRTSVTNKGKPRKEIEKVAFSPD